MRVEVVHLRKEFGETVAVQDVSFAFGSGEVYGFVGPNGAGKTTTMRILATIDEPTSGEALVDGVSVVEEPERARRLVGFVPDSLPAHRDISVFEYLDFFARAYGLRGEERRRVVREVSDFTNVSGIRDKMVSSLSKGMKQRVCLGRALLHDPPVLILDEPAAGLDPRARIELRELLRALSGQGKAILISSHILTELAEICTGALIIERGRILRAGAMHEILEHGGPRRKVTLRPLSPLHEARLAVLECPSTSACCVVGSEIEVDVEGGEEAAADLLTYLVSRGVRLLEFRQQRSSLEDVFMSVTKGDVQ